MAARSTYKGMPIPAWFMPESAEAFASMELKESDIILVTYPKCGTTWTQKILNCLRRMDENGEMVSEPDICSEGQVYPDAVPLERPAEPRPIFGYGSLQELLAQAEPRLLSTHLPAPFLPDLSKGGGRLVYVLRNPKDAITSLHFFRGEAKDGWLGNEHGPGSFNRFLADPTPNAFGSYWDHIREMEKLVDTLGPRALVLYYEEIKADPHGQVTRLAEFLGIKPSKKLIDAVVDATTFKAMVKEKEGTPRSFLTRKGEVGDWKNHLDAATWNRVDEVFEERCGKSKLYQPLRQWMT